MPTIKLTQDQMKNLITLVEGQEYEGILLLEEGLWVDKGKYSYQTLIFELARKHYRFTHYRTGSYYDCYIYEVDEGHHLGNATEVEKIKVEKIEWRPVEDQTFGIRSPTQESETVGPKTDQ